MDSRHLHRHQQQAALLDAEKSMVPELPREYLETDLNTPGERTVDLLAVDPATIGAATYWEPQFGASSIE